MTAMDKYHWDTQEIPNYLKKELDTRFGCSWHVVAGEEFGFDVDVEVRERRPPTELHYINQLWLHPRKVNSSTFSSVLWPCCSGNVEPSYSRRSNTGNKRKRSS